MRFKVRWKILQPILFKIYQKSISQDSFAARYKSFFNSFFDQPSIFPIFSKSVLVQMSIVSSSGMLVKRESTSRLPIKNSESCSTISSAKANESFTVYSFLVKDFKTGARNFATLQHLKRLLISALALFENTEKVEGLS